MKHTVMALSVCVALLTARPAQAQDMPRVGITMGFPAAVGVIWNVADRVAIRPELTLAGSSTSSDSAIASIVGLDTGSTGDGFQVGVGLSALIYIGRWDALRTYVSPRFSFSHATTSATSLGSSSDTTSKAYFTSGSFGAQYVFARHFSVFGEVGVGYTSTTTTLSTTSTPLLVVPLAGPTLPSVTTRFESHGKSWSARSGVGVIFYF